MVEVMRRVGWRAEQLDGGYKRYRQWVLAELKTRPATLRLVAVAGKTGTGKTVLLSALRNIGAQVADLEALANHRGSVFGGMGKQPSQRMFESRLLAALCAPDPARPVFVGGRKPQDRRVAFAVGFAVGDAVGAGGSD